MDPQNSHWFMQAVRRLTSKHGCAKLDIPFPLACTIVAQIQLALRHPANTGESAHHARAFIEALIGTMEASEPAIGPLLRLGFDPAHDHHP